MKRLMTNAAATVLALAALSTSAGAVDVTDKVYVPLGSAGELAVIDPQ